MAIALVSSLTATPGGSGGTTAALDTSGANLLILSVSWYTINTANPSTISDSKGNTWTALTRRNSPSGHFAHRLWYATNPTVGTGHTFTVTASADQYPAILVYAFSGCDTAAPFVVENGANGSDTPPLAAGSVTPAANGELVISGFAGNAFTGVTASGLTVTSINSSPAFNINGAVGYLIQSTAAAINPSWSWSGSDFRGCCASVAVFTHTAGVTTARVSQAAIELLSQPVPAARVSQAVVEVLGTLVAVPAASARVSQAAIELLSQPVPAARVSQAVVEVLAENPLPIATRVTQAAVEWFSATAAPSRVSQVAVEVFVPTPPRPEILHEGWLAWVEWPEAAEAVALSSGPIPPIVAYSDWDLQDPPSYYHGYKQARVERFGQATRTLSEARSGDWQGSAFDFRLSDFDRILRTQLESLTDRYWNVGHFICRMVTRPVRAALGEPLIIFVGPLRRADPVAPLSMELLLEDAVGHGMLSEQLLIPQRVVDASDWDDVEIVESAKGHPVPIIYGTHSRPAGAFAPIYLGLEDDGTDHVWLVAGHYAHVIDIFIDGISVLGTEGTDWTLPGMSGPAYEEVAGKRYTLIRGRKGDPATVTDPILYGDNVGWAVEGYYETWMASYPMDPTDPHFDVNATVDPHSGTRCITGTDLQEGELVLGNFGSTSWEGLQGYALDDYDDLHLWIKNATASWILSTLYINFGIRPTPADPIESVGIVVEVYDGQYGFDETNVTTWQELVIPLSDFMADPGARADYITIQKWGEDDISLSLDDITLAGSPPEGEVTQADAVAAGTRALTINVEGWTTTGDDEGDVYHDIYDQYYHWLVNYVAHPDGYQTGASLTNPTVDLFDRVVNVVLAASFAAAKTQAEARYPPTGYLGHAIFGAGPGDRLPVRSWISRWNLSADCRFGVTRYGELFIVLHEPTLADQEAAPVVDEVLDILEGSFSIEMGWEVQATRIPFRADYNWATGEWLVFRDAEDTATSEAYGRPEGIPGTVREYLFIKDTDQAKNVGEHEVQRVGHPPRVLQFETNLGQLVTQELGSYIVVRHFAGVGPSEERLCQIEELTIGPGTRRLRVRALDVTALVPPEEEAMSAVLGDGVLGVMILGSPGEADDGRSARSDVVQQPQGRRDRRQ
jgi:hypothetical protein